MSIKYIAPVDPPWPFEAYTHIIRPLTEEEGGGFLITLPDLPGCMADGETPEEAFIEAKDAFECWIAAQVDMGRPVPEPKWRPEEDTTPKVSGKFVQRIPRTLHSKLVKRAKQEGVSLNTLVLTLIAEGIGKREGMTGMSA
ncbi:MAG: type II toxin-antitoxin system HicB family antitoxin [Proteobacteria bacterium]|nr:type II toxin-antitoxin system HicB family antitoxin [Pseudomonadota bacterium]